jgi:hypothetical protein
VPVEIRDPNSCSHSSTTSRREIRLRTDSPRSPRESAARMRCPRRRWAARRGRAGRSPGSARAGSDARSRSPGLAATPRPDDAPGRHRRPARRRRTHGRRRTRWASGRRTRPPPTPAAAVAPCPRGPAGRPACAPTGPCRAWAACSADRRSGAARSCASCDPAAARAVRSARPAARRASLAAGSARPSAAAPRRPRPCPARRSPRPRPAPHTEIRRRPVTVCPPNRLNAYHTPRPRRDFAAEPRGVCRKGGSVMCAGQGTSNETPRALASAREQASKPPFLRLSWWTNRGTTGAFPLLLLARRSSCRLTARSHGKRYLLPAPASH